jgi:hypothetical protein
MTWNNVPCYRTKNFLFLDHGIMDCIFVTTYCDKIICCKKGLTLIFSSNFVNNKILMPRHDVHVCKLHLYKIH